MRFQLAANIVRNSAEWVILTHSLHDRMNYLGAEWKQCGQRDGTAPDNNAKCTFDEAPFGTMPVELTSVSVGPVTRTRTNRSSLASTMTVH